MRIAITADNHLTTQQDHPERFATLQNILKQCGELDLDRLIIAGDLFDQSQQNYAEFEEAVTEARPENLSVVVIPGNHDPQLTQGSLAVEGLEVFSEPVIQPVGAAVLISLICITLNNFLTAIFARLLEQ